MLLFILLVVVIVGGYFLYTHLKEQKEFSEFSKVFNIGLEELAKFNGVASKRIFVGVKGDIFEVSNSPFYTPGGTYHIFAGKDASISLAKSDLEGKYLNNQTEQLNEEEQQSLDEWHNKFTEKYRKVGKLTIKN